MNKEIKIATTNDLVTINELIRLSKAYWGYDEDFIERFMQEFSMTPEKLQKTTTHLLFIDDKPAGIFGFEINSDDELELDNFFLHPDYVGKGLGRELWDEACRTAKNLGKSEFIIWSDPNAENFYLKMGCEKIGVRKSSLMPDRYPPVLRFKISSG